MGMFAAEKLNLMEDANVLRSASIPPTRFSMVMAGGASQGSKLKLTESLVFGTEHVIEEQLGGAEAEHCRDLIESGGNVTLAISGVMSHGVTSISEV